MNIGKLRNNLLIQIVVALILGVALHYFTAYARQITAPVFTYTSSLLFNLYLEPSVEVPLVRLIILDSSHAFVSAIFASVIGLTCLHFSFKIHTMFLPLISCVSFYITTNLWFFSNIPELFQAVASNDILVALLRHLAPILAWLFMSWVLIHWVLPNTYEPSPSQGQ